MAETSTSDLKSLRERVEEATEGSRELDARLWCVAEGRTFRKMLSPPVAFRTSGGDVGLYDAPRYTASIDAALALVGRKLGGKIGPIGLMLAGSGQCTLESPDPCGWMVQKVAATPPLAIILALLSALQHPTEQPDSQGEGDCG